MRITDLATTADTIEGESFENCEIVGPAVLVPMGSALVECSFEGEMDALLYELTGGRRYLGLIALKNCSFVRCRFRRIGLAGDATFCMEMRYGTDFPPPST